MGDQPACGDPYLPTIVDLDTVPRPDPTSTPGQIAYDSYTATSGGASLVSGDPLPDWAQLPEQIRLAWETAATAVCLEQLARLIDQGFLPDTGTS